MTELWKVWEPKQCWGRVGRVGNVGTVQKSDSQLDYSVKHIGLLTLAEFQGQHIFLLLPSLSSLHDGHLVEQSSLSLKQAPSGTVHSTCMAIYPISFGTVLGLP